MGGLGRACHNQQPVQPSRHDLRLVIAHGGDNDLGTPNQDFGGPGVGDGGKAGMPGENSQALGKVLIISEDNKPANPDDNGGGGTVVFTFDLGIRMDEVHILDIDDYTLAGTVRAYSDVNGGNLLVSNRMAGLGDNSVQVVPVNATGVRRLEIEFPGGGDSGCHFMPQSGVEPIRHRRRDLARRQHRRRAGRRRAGRFRRRVGAVRQRHEPGSGKDEHEFLRRLPVQEPAGGQLFGEDHRRQFRSGRAAGRRHCLGAFSAGAAAVTLPLDGGANLAVIGGFILPGGSGGEAGPQTALVSLSDNRARSTRSRW